MLRLKLVRKFVQVGILISALYPPASSLPMTAAEFEQQLRQAEREVREAQEWINNTPRNSEEFKEIVRMMQSGLGIFGYGTGPYDGVLNVKTQNAIRAYQRTNALKETGEVDGETLRKVSDDFKTYSKQIPSLPMLSVDLDGWEHGEIRVTGTWDIEGGAQADPIQATEIRCFRDRKICFEATAMHQEFQQLNIYTEAYDIERWDEHEITTRPVNFKCVRYTLRVARAQHSVTGIRLRTKTEGICKGVEQELRLRLIDGYKMSFKMQQERGAKVRNLIRWSESR